MRRRRIPPEPYMPCDNNTGKSQKEQSKFKLNNKPPVSNGIQLKRKRLNLKRNRGFLICPVARPPPLEKYALNRNENEL